MDRETWIRNKIDFINTTLENSLNGWMHPEFYSLDDEKKIVTVKFQLKEWEKNGLDSLHGGLINCMMDLCMSLTVHAYSDVKIPPTISMSTNYVRPVPLRDGEKLDYLLIEVELDSMGKRFSTASCKAIIGSSGKIAATSMGTYAINPLDVTI